MRDGFKLSDDWTSRAIAVGELNDSLAGQQAVSVFVSQLDQGTAVNYIVLSVHELGLLVDTFNLPIV